MARPSPSVDVVDVDNGAGQDDLWIEKIVPPPITVNGTAGARAPPLPLQPMSQVASAPARLGSAGQPFVDVDHEAKRSSQRPVDVDEMASTSDAAACSISGFSQQPLNTIYSVRRQVLVNSRETYWSHDRQFFLYFQATTGLWQICPRWEPPRQVGAVPGDLLVDAQLGGSRGVAMQVSGNFWREFLDGVWRLVKLNVRNIDTGSTSAGNSPAPPSWMGNVRPLKDRTEMSRGSGTMKVSVTYDSTLAQGAAQRAVASGLSVWIGYFRRGVSTKDIHHFFDGIPVCSVSHTQANQSHAVVAFGTELDRDAAVQRSGQLLGGNRVEVEPIETPGADANRQDADEQTAEGELKLNSLGYPLRPGQPACSFYLLKGWCKFSSKCSLDHPELERPAEVSIAESVGANPTTVDHGKDDEDFDLTEFGRQFFQRERGREMSEELAEVKDTRSSQKSKLAKLSKREKKHSEDERQEKKQRKEKENLMDKHHEVGAAGENKKKHRKTLEIVAGPLQEDAFEVEAFRHSVGVVGDNCKVGVLTRPDISSPTTGKYLVSGSTAEVIARAVSTVDGRVYLRLHDQPGWVSTRSRKDSTKVVLSAVGSNAVQLEPSESISEDNFLKWLLGLDKFHGELLHYHERLTQYYMDVSELCLVVQGPDGEVPDPQFFTDLCVENKEHQEIFRKWFRAQAI